MQVCGVCRVCEVSIHMIVNTCMCVCAGDKYMHVHVG